MKVIHVIPSVSRLRGGPSQAVLAMVKALREQGVDAEIATTNDNGYDLLDVPLNQRIDYEKVPVWFFPRFSPPLKEFIFSAALTRWLWQHLRNYDIVHAHYLFSYASTCTGAISRWQGVPYLVRTLDHLSPWSLAQSQLKKQSYLFLIERHNLNCANAIHCTSKSEAEEVRRFGVKAPITTLPIGVDRNITCPEAKQKLRLVYGIPAETPVVLFLSRLHPKKRPDLLIEALGQLDACNYDFHLILAGSGEPDYLTYLTNLISSRGLTSQISLPGFVSGQDKELLLEGSDMFVLPSFSENFGIAVAEAMAAGLPVIVTSGVQIAPEIAAESAGLVVEGDLEALQSGIAQLLSSPNLRCQLGENGQRLVSRRYAWSVIASHLTSVYSAILSKQPLPDYLTDNSHSK